MERQEILIKVWNYFITKRNKFSVGDKGCFYRNAEGARCGIGCLFPDSLYKPEMDTLNDTRIRYNHIVFKALRKVGIDVDKNLDFLVHIQQAHDNAAASKSKLVMKKELLAIAKEYNLKAPGRL